MAFIDEAVISVQSGGGGNGCISFRREKYIPMGGPNGGNGGRGGSVIFKATRDKTSLLDFKFQPIFEAKRGEHGMGSDCYGRGADDLEIQVPLGTLIFDQDTQELVADLKDDGQEVMVAKGGKGGIGNMHFKSSTNRAPRIATTGEPGVKRELKLELKLLADVGLVGLPNAGKSTFLSSISRAHPKIANYPFTTLEPSLGVVGHQGQSFVVADLPGLIEGASEGAGLGHQFLRHVSRNRLLLHLVDVSADNAEIKQNIETVEKELALYDADLGKRERIIVFTKCDVLSAEDLKKKKRSLKKFDGFFISSHSHQGIKELLDALAEKASAWKQAS